MEAIIESELIVKIVSKILQVPENQISINNSKIVADIGDQDYTDIYKRMYYFITSPISYDDQLINDLLDSFAERNIYTKESIKEWYERRQDVSDRRS